MDKKHHVNLTLNFTYQDVNVVAIKNNYQGFFQINQYQLNHKLFNGQQSPTFVREVFERGDGVVVLPYDPIKDTVVLQTQFRVGAIREHDNPWLLECVAGMFSKNESPIEVAIREAKEEANLTLDANHIEPICQYYVSPGGTTEKIHLYIGKVDSDKAGGIYGLPEENEDILVQTFHTEEAIALLNAGKITNGATIIALQWLALNVEKLKARWQPS